MILRMLEKTNEYQSDMKYFILQMLLIMRSFRACDVIYHLISTHPMNTNVLQTTMFQVHSE